MEGNKTVWILLLFVALAQGVVLYKVFGEQKNNEINLSHGSNYVTASCDDDSASVRVSGPDGSLAMYSEEGKEPFVGVYSKKGNTGIQGNKFIYVDSRGARKVFDFNSVQDQQRRIDTITRDLRTARLKLDSLQRTVDRLNRQGQQTGQAPNE